MQAESVALLRHEPEIRKPVIIREKNVQRPYTTLGDMVWIFRDHHPCHSFHVEIISTIVQQRQEL